MGAVSPAMRATARIVPVIKPPFAEGNMTLIVVLHRCMPRAMDASRTLFGTSLSDSSVVLATMGIIINANATAPAIGEKRPVKPTTIRLYAVMPTIMEGNPVNMSLMVRIHVAYLLAPYSARYTPVNTPIGIPMALVNPIKINVPCMAGPMLFRRPFPVKNCQFMAGAPRTMTSKRILSRGTMAIMTQIKQST